MFVKACTHRLARAIDSNIHLVTHGTAVWFPRAQARPEQAESYIPKEIRDRMAYGIREQAKASSLLPASILLTWQRKRHVLGACSSVG